MIQSFTCTKKEVAKWRADKGALYSLMSRQKWWWEKKKETDKYSGEIKETCSKQSATGKVVLTIWKWHFIAKVRGLQAKEDQDSSNRLKTAASLSRMMWEFRNLMVS